MNKGTERLWTVNKAQEECAHGGWTPGQEMKPRAGLRQLPHGDGRTNDSYAEARVAHPDAWVPSGGGGETYTGATRWQHVGEEAKQEGVAVRDVRPGAWEQTDRPDRRSNDSGAGVKQLTVGGSVGRDLPSGAATCTYCGAWWGSLGLEPVLDCGRPNGELCAQCYVCHTVLWTRAVWEILADDGVCFINLADSYLSAGSAQVDGTKQVRGSQEGAWNGASRKPPSGMKAKDLAGMPGRVVQALQLDGWYRRADIVWVKGLSLNKKGLDAILKPFEGQYPPKLREALEKELYVGNSMPESVADRPTRGFEHIFMLTKQERYTSDMVAVREDLIRPEEVDRVTPGLFGGAFGVAYNGAGSRLHSGNPYTKAPSGRNLRSAWIFPTAGFGWHLCEACMTVYDPQEYKRLPKIKVKVDWRKKAAMEQAPADTEETVNHMGGGNTGFGEANADGTRTLELGVCATCGRSDAWGSHFSSFPITLPETAILMGSPVAVCSACRKPYERLTTKSTRFEGGSGKAGRTAADVNSRGTYAGRVQNGENIKLGPVVTFSTEGFRPICDCNSDPAPALVLDPFAGTSTTLLAAVQNGREGIGIELSENYAAISAERLRRDAEKREA